MGKMTVHIGIEPGSGLVGRFGDTVILIPRDAATEGDADEVAGELLDLSAAIASDPGLPASMIAARLATWVVSHMRDDGVVFGIVAPVHDGVVMFLRGAVWCEVTDHDSTRQLSGEQALTWVDQIVPGSFERLSIGSTAGQPVRAHPRSDLRDGVVPGQGFVLTRLGSARQPGPVASGAGSDPGADSPLAHPATSAPSAAPADRAPPAGHQGLPGTTETLPGTAETAASPRPAETAASPRPAETAAGPRPAETAASTGPAETAASTRPAETAAAETGGDRGEHETGGDRGEHETGGDRGEHETGGDRGEHETGGDRGEDETGGDRGEHETGGDRGEHETGGDRGQPETGGDRGEPETGRDRGRHGGECRATRTGRQAPSCPRDGGSADADGRAEVGEWACHFPGPCLRPRP